MISEKLGTLSISDKNEKFWVSFYPSKFDKIQHSYFFDDLNRLMHKPHILQQYVLECLY